MTTHDRFDVRTTDGEPLPLRPSELPVLTYSDELHVVHGDLDGEGGGHAWDSNRVGKTLFPRRWGHDVAERVVRVMRGPELVRLDSSGDGLAFVGIVDDVIVLVRLTRAADGSWRFRTAYPLNGRGVVRRTATGTVDRPLDRAMLERYA